MQVTCEISLYPFNENYKQIIHDFAQRLIINSNLTVESNTMSTLISGDYDLIMDILKQEIQSTFKNNKAAIVFKIREN